MMAKRKEARWRTPEVEPVIGRVRGQRSGLKEALAKDRRGWVGGLRELDMNAAAPARRTGVQVGSYSAPSDKIALVGKRLGGEDFPHTLLHEIAHRGQDRLADEDYAAFTRKKLGDAEDFANSYASYVTGQQQHPDLHGFWRSRLDPDQEVGRAFGGRVKRRADKRRRGHD